MRAPTVYSLLTVLTAGASAVVAMLCVVLAMIGLRLAVGP